MTYHIVRNDKDELHITRENELLFTLTMRQLVEMLYFHQDFQRLVVRMRDADGSQHRVNPFIDIYLCPNKDWKLTIRHYARGGFTVSVSGKGEETDTIPRNEIVLVLAEVLKHTL